MNEPNSCPSDFFKYKFLHSLIDVAYSKGEADNLKWVPESKPRIREAMPSIASFRYLAFHTKQQVLIMTADEKVCFNQFALSPEELWKSNTLFRDEKTNKPVWATERVMPFGIFPASGIAHRKA